MRILQISGASPVPRGDGSTATFATVRAVCRAGHQITYTYVRSPKEAHTKARAYAAEIEKACLGNLAFHPLRGGPARLRWFERATHVLAAAHSLLGTDYRWEFLAHPIQALQECRRLAFTLNGFDRTAIVQLRRLLTRNRPDIIQVDYPWMMAIGAHLPRSIPKLFVAHELQSEVTSQRFPGNPSLYNVIRRREMALAQRFDAVATLSAEDAALLRGHCARLPIYHSPLAIECRGVQEPRSPVRNGAPIRFTFLGGGAHPPNVDAVEWLCREIVPELRAVFPQMVVQIIGRYPPEFVKKWRAVDIAFLGFVDDFTDLINGSVFLCPIRIASGMRIKILDAIFRGAAVVSTTMGASGLGLTPGKHYLAANTPGEFASQCRRLAETHNLPQRLAQAAQKKALTTFSPQAAGRRRIEVLRQVIAAHKQGNQNSERQAA